MPLFDNRPVSAAEAEAFSLQQEADTLRKQAAEFDAEICRLNPRGFICPGGDELENFFEKAGLAVSEWPDYDCTAAALARQSGTSLFHHGRKGYMDFGFTAESLQELYGRATVKHVMAVFPLYTEAQAAEHLDLLRRTCPPEDFEWNPVFAAESKRDQLLQDAEKLDRQAASLS